MNVFQLIEPKQASLPNGSFGHWDSMILSWEISSSRLLKEVEILDLEQLLHALLEKKVENSVGSRSWKLEASGSN